MAYSVLSVTKMTAAQLATYKGVEGMIVINTDTDSIHVLDGAQGGGYSLPNENTVQNYVNNQVTTIMTSGGQILPAAATTTGNVVTWDGGAWQEDSSFAQTSYVDAEIANLKPSTPSSTGQALQWDGTQFVHVTMTGGGGGGGVVPTAVTPAGSVLTWDGSAYQNTTGFALTTDLSTAVTNLKGTASISFDTLGKIETAVLANSSSLSTVNTTLPTLASKIYVDTKVSDLLGGASTAYDTLKEIEDFVVTNSSNIGTMLTTMGTKAPKPSVATPTGSALTWDGTNFQNSSDFPVKPASNSLADEVLAWDLGSGGFVQKDLSGLAAIGSATTYTDLGLVETELANKAPIPPNGIAAGEFLRWDETNKVFTFATPAGGGGGSTIPTPAVTTDTSTAGAMQVLIWDNDSGDLKNVPSPFAEPPPASAAGEYLRWDATTGWVNDTPAGGGSSFGTPSSATLANEAVTWDGVSSFVNSAGYAMLSDISGKVDKPSVSTGTTEVLKWNQSTGALENVSGFAQIGAASTLTDLGLIETAVNAKAEAPPTQSTTGTYLYHDGTSWQYGTPVSGGGGISGPTSGVTPSGSALTWDGSALQNTSGFALVGTASTLTNLGLVETAVNSKADVPPTQATTGTYLYHDGSSWQYGTAVATEAYVDTAISNLLGGASTAYDTLKEIEDYITNNSDSNMTSLLGDLALKVSKPAASTPADHVLVYNATSGALETKDWMGAGIWEVVDNGSEYVVQLKAGAVPA